LLGKISTITSEAKNWARSAGLAPDSIVLRYCLASARFSEGLDMGVSPVKYTGERDGKF
jgi:hypothetical protein